MSFEIDGKIHKIFDTESKTETFQARDFVLSLSGPYPQYIKFQLTQDRCELISSYNENDEVKVHFDLRGREWNGNYFTNLNVWKIESLSNLVDSEPESFGSIEDGGFPAESDGQKENIEFDDLPF